MSLDLAPLWLTLKLAALTTVLLCLLGIPFAYWLAHCQHRLKPLLQSLLLLPLVLPPTVLGFYLLLLFSPQHAFGHWLISVAGVRLTFSFEGLIIASLIFSFPFLVYPIQAAFANLPASLREASACLGKSAWQTFWHVSLPNVGPAVLSGAVLAFVHTVGEFGVVMMIGGNLPERTRVVSIAIYDAVEALQYETAHLYSACLVMLALIALFLVHQLQGRR